jgi:hypothetical protein
MPLRAFFLLLALLAAGALVAASTAAAQTQEEELEEFWERYPLEAPDEGSAPAGAAEEQRGPDPSRPMLRPPPARGQGPLPLVLLSLALAVALVGVAGGIRRVKTAGRDESRGRSDELARDAGDPAGAGAGTTFAQTEQRKASEGQSANDPGGQHAAHGDSGGGTVPSGRTARGGTAS